MPNSNWRGRLQGRRKVLVGAAAAIGIVVVGALSAVGVADAAKPAPEPWLNPKKPIAARVNALLGAMTLAEKVGQMDQQLVPNVTAPGGGTACGSEGFNLPSATCMQTVLIDQHAGSLLAGGTDSPIDTTGHGGVGNTGFDWANEYNQIQKYAIENSRLHIPLIFGVDAVHGFGHPWQAPLFPQSIGMGATWDPAAARAGGVVTANAVRATGWNWVFAPVQDLVPRQPVGSHLRDVGRGTGADRGHGRRQCARNAAACFGEFTLRGGDRQAFRRVFAGGKWTRPQ